MSVFMGNVTSQFQTHALAGGFSCSRFWPGRAHPQNLYIGTDDGENFEELLLTAPNSLG